MLTQVFKVTSFRLSEGSLVEKKEHTLSIPLFLIESDSRAYFEIVRKNTISSTGVSLSVTSFIESAISESIEKREEIIGRHITFALIEANTAVAVFCGTTDGDAALIRHLSDGLSNPNRKYYSILH